MPINIALFCSGGGTNAEVIMQRFKRSKTINVVALLANKADAFALQRAGRHNVPAYTFTKAELNNTTLVDEILYKHEVDIIVLAGFLLLFPERLVQRYMDRVINIHPALLPNFGGKGMFGNAVHEAVVAAGHTASGITIHLVNSKYDEGRILLQAQCAVYVNDTAITLAQRIHSLEYAYFWPAIKYHALLMGKLNV